MPLKLDIKSGEKMMINGAVLENVGPNAKILPPPLVPQRLHPGDLYAPSPEHREACRKKLMGLRNEGPALSPASIAGESPCRRKLSSDVPGAPSTPVR